METPARRREDSQANGPLSIPEADPGDGDADPPLGWGGSGVSTPRSPFMKRRGWDHILHPLRRRPVRYITRSQYALLPGYKKLVFGGGGGRCNPSPQVEKVGSRSSRWAPQGGGPGAGPHGLRTAGPGWWTGSFACGRIEHSARKQSPSKQVNIQPNHPN